MKDPSNEIKAIATKHKMIASIWTTEDVQSIREDLSDRQAFEVLQYAERNHDACIGINWDVLEDHADSLFPKDA